MSDASCLTRPRLLYALLMVSRTIMRVATFFATVCRKHVFRRVALNKWFPLNSHVHREFPGKLESEGKLGVD